MRYNNLSTRINVLNFDSISKLNFYKKTRKQKKFFRFKKLKLLALFDSADKLFYKKIIVLANVISNWFNQKLYVYKIINQKNLRKNNIFYQLGCTITNINKITKIIDYINNIMKLVSLRIDNNLRLSYYNRYVIYKFDNLNYLLGLNNSRYFNIKIAYNIVVIYDLNININKINLRQFYEKIFFL